MHQFLETLKAKAVEHKALLIKVGSALVGTALGAVVGSVVAANLEEDEESYTDLDTEDEVAE